MAEVRATNEFKLALIKGEFDGKTNGPFSLRVGVDHVEQGSADLDVSVVDRRGKRLISVWSGPVSVNGALTLTNVSEVFNVSVR